MKVTIIIIITTVTLVFGGRRKYDNVIASEITTNVEIREFDSTALDSRGVNWETSFGPSLSERRFPEVRINRIRSDEEAISVGGRMGNFVRTSINSEFELVGISHDPDMSLWIFRYFYQTGYGEFVFGSSFQVAIDGENGEILRMWWD